MANRTDQRTLAGQAMSAIQRRIVSGEYEPGSRLRIEELAEDLEMSPMPVREALQRLDSRGFVEHLPHRGARVSELSVDDLVDIYSVRIPLEMLAVRRAARYFTPQDAAEGKRWLNEYMQYDAADWQAREAQMEFHLAIYAAARSPWLTRTIRPLFENSERYRIAALGETATRGRRKRHQALLDSCIAHDEDTAADRLVDLVADTVRVIEPKLRGEARFELEPVQLVAYLPPPDPAD